MKQFLAVLLLLAGARLPAATYYVATNGSAAAAGTSNAPFATPQQAVSVMVAGDTTFVHGGNYPLSSQIKPNVDGVATNYCRLWAFPGEKPVLDFATMPGSNKALDVRRDFWHAKGFEIVNAPNSGIFVGGLSNVIEGCAVHDCGFDGVVLGSSSVRATNALILNCDSYRNYPPGTDGNNGDGFAGKIGCGPGNVFRGCRAWNNCDDGWDFYDTAAGAVVLENCWAFSNGFNLWNYAGTWSGNGNGFKMGGEGTPAEHNLTNSVAFGNRSKGFDHNNGAAGQTMVNCTSSGNGAANFSFYETPTKGTRLYNLLINCASFGGGLLYNLDPTTVQISNSWQLVTVIAADFASLDTSAATNARNADFSLPVTPLFRLSPGSQLIDRGTNVGLPFSGVRPDLGAFEFIPGGEQAAAAFDLKGCGMTEGGFRLKLDGLTSHGPVILAYSTNLTNWTLLATNPATTGSTTFLDAGIAARPRSFYRAQEQ